MLFNKNKKGVYFFLIDVLIAAFIFLVTVLTLFSFRSFTPSLEGSTQSIDNVYGSLCMTEIKDIGGNNPSLFQLQMSNYSCPRSFTIDECLWLLYYNLNLNNVTNISNHPNYPLWINYSGAIISNSTSWLSDNYGFTFSIDGNLLYYKPASITTFENSSTKLSRRKITVLTPNVTFTAEPVISEVVVWS